MTMQVGMVGTDGVLVASDTRWMNTPRWANPGPPPRATFNSTKIRISYERGLAISDARNMETVRYVADEIISGMKEEDAKAIVSSPEFTTTMILCGRSFLNKTTQSTVKRRLLSIVTSGLPVIRPRFCSVRRSSFIWRDCSVTLALIPELLRTTRFRR
jgi:hypothetical protein